MGAHPPAMGAHPPVLWRGLLALCLPLLLLLSPGSSQVVKLENGLEGGTIQLKPTFVAGEVEGFTWKKGENKIVEVDFPGVPIYYGPAGKHSLDNENGVLDIRDLTIQDEGPYRAEVLIDSRYTYSHFQLRVFPALPQPHVECSTTNGNVTAWCHLDGKYSKSLTYMWDTEHKYILSDNKTNLTVINAKRDSMDLIKCVVENPASRNSSSVSLKTCFPEEGNGSVAAIGIGIFILVIILVLIGIFCCWKKGVLKRCPPLQSCLNPICTLLNACLDSARKRLNGLLTSARQLLNCQNTAEHPDPKDGGFERVPGEEEQDQKTDGQQEQNDGRHSLVTTAEMNPRNDQSTIENKASEKETKEDRGQSPKDSRSSLEHRESADESENKTRNDFLHNREVQDPDTVKKSANDTSSSNYDDNRPGMAVRPRPPGDEDQITKTAEDGTSETQEPLLNETKSPTGHQQTQESLGGPSTYEKGPTVKDPTVNKEETRTGSSCTAGTQNVEE